MSRYLFRTTDGALMLPLEAVTVTRCIVDAALSLEGLRDGELITLRVEGPFSIQEGKHAMAIDPSSTKDLGPAVALFGATVRRALALESGQLEVWFEDGRTLTVEPSDEYEAWELSGPGDAKAVCRVGGGVSTWAGTK